MCCFSQFSLRGRGSRRLSGSVVCLISRVLYSIHSCKSESACLCVMLVQWTALCPSPQRFHVCRFSQFSLRRRGSGRLSGSIVCLISRLLHSIQSRSRIEFLLLLVCDTGAVDSDVYVSEVPRVLFLSILPIS